MVLTCRAGTKDSVVAESACGVNGRQRNRMHAISTTPRSDNARRLRSAMGGGFNVCCRPSPPLSLPSCSLHANRARLRLQQPFTAGLHRLQSFWGLHKSRHWILGATQTIRCTVRDHTPSSRASLRSTGSFLDARKFPATRQTRLTPRCVSGTRTAKYACRSCLPTY